MSEESMPPGQIAQSRGLCSGRSKLAYPSVKMMGKMVALECSLVYSSIWLKIHLKQVPPPPISLKSDRMFDKESLSV
jgi:hypothetical protein